jgi:copper chaperone CopZ
MLNGCIYKDRKIKNTVINISENIVINILNIECEFCKDNVINIIKESKGVKSIDIISIDFQDNNIFKIIYNDLFNIEELKHKLNEEGFILQYQKN